MKKNFNKKLVLNKRTVMDLIPSELDGVKGGVYPTSPTHCQGNTCLPCKTSLYPVTACATLICGC